MRRPARTAPFIRISRPHPKKPEQKLSPRALTGRLRRPFHDMRGVALPRQAPQRLDFLLWRPARAATASARARFFFNSANALANWPGA